MDGKKKNRSDVVIIGFTMFAVFFGAGNLIFPPYLGMTAGRDWFVGFICFILADAGLALMTVMSVMRGDGTITACLARMGNGASRLVATVAMACVGPLICIPRTAATTYEMGILPLLPKMNSWVFSAIFFVVVYLLTVRPSKVVDIIGKFLTPMMLLTIAVLVIKGIMTPIGPIRPEGVAGSVAKEGFMAGYQTMDVLGALAITIVLVDNISQRGYMEKKERQKVMFRSGLVAAAGLFAVYCGMTYLGATASSMELGDVNQAGLVVLVTELLLKRFGVVLLALIVIFACMTTAIGLTSSSAEYFHKLSGGRISYTALVGAFCLFSMVVSNVGITTIINIASPVLDIIYPVLLTQIFLTFFSDKIKKDGVYKGAALGALIISIAGLAESRGAPLAFVNSLPLASIGLNWIAPSIIGGIIGHFLPGKVKTQSENK